MVEIKTDLYIIRRLKMVIPLVFSAQSVFQTNKQKTEPAGVVLATL